MGCRFLLATGQGIGQATEARGIEGPGLQATNSRPGDGESAFSAGTADLTDMPPVDPGIPALPDHGLGHGQHGWELALAFEVSATSPKPAHVTLAVC